MAFTNHTRSVVERNPARPAVHRLKAPRPVQPCPTRHLDVDQYVRLLTCIEDEGGIASLDDLSRALPTVAKPVSAVFDLCDAGVLGVDLDAPFGGSTLVWRIDR